MRGPGGLKSTVTLRLSPGGTMSDKVKVSFDLFKCPRWGFLSLLDFWSDPRVAFPV